MYVYGLIDPQTNCFRYVGITNDLERRYNQHVTCSNSKNFAKDCWVKSLRLQSLKPMLVVLEECEDEQQALDAEARWIQTGLRLGWPLLNFNKVELAEYPDKISVEIAEWLMEKHKDKIVDHLVDALLDELRVKTEAKERKQADITSLQAAVLQWRRDNPNGIQADCIRAMAAQGLTLSRQYASDLWKIQLGASPMAWQEDGNVQE